MYANSESFFDRRPMFEARVRASFDASRPSRMRRASGTTYRDKSFTNGTKLERLRSASTKRETLLPKEIRILDDDRRNGGNSMSKTRLRNTLKGFIFIFCFSCFLYQSVKFCILYYEYPTTTSFAATTPRFIKKPAISFCNDSPVNRKYFCENYPHLCMKPTDITSHCEEFPFTCTGNTSDLQTYYFTSGYRRIKDENGKSDEDKFPNVTYPYPEQIKEAVSEIYLSHNLSDDGKNPWSWSIESSGANLHFDDDAESETHEIIDQRNKGINPINSFHLEVGRAENFVPWFPYTVQFFVHSPFVPVIFETQYIILKYGCTYEVHVRLTFKTPARDTLNVICKAKKWRHIQNTRITYNLRPRKEAVAHFRLITSHHFLGERLHKKGVLNTNICPICESGIMNSYHLFDYTGLDRHGEQGETRRSP
ncbi:hypothetical protein NPIL_427841 [Nephila pilipes]|uniref:Uncharacterized protein n=1 Tax=Nephila pilipes TaxID=299642 RepID=A0A8X6U1S6_NEPPI|nr:hypothetical protein NPIL_427841 [Nephila pilipes]